MQGDSGITPLWDSPKKGRESWPHFFDGRQFVTYIEFGWGIPPIAASRFATEQATRADTRRSRGKGTHASICQGQTTCRRPSPGDHPTL